MNRSVETAARRHITELEARVAQQEALVEGLVASKRDASAATRTLRVLEKALLLTKEYHSFVLRGRMMDSSSEPRPARA